jgi:CRISPR/Cas system CSM-associated protein Csm2 small subunit
MRITYRIKLDVIENLKEDINREIEKDSRFTNDIIEEHLNNLQDDINHQINCEGANACIYYSDCFDIVKELGVTDWEDLNKDLGEISDICSLAMYSLINEIYERFESDIYDEMTLYYDSLRINNPITFK